MRMNFKIKSSHIQVALLTFASILIVQYALHVSPKLVKSPIPKSKIWYLGKGDYFLDTIQGSYHHLVTDFPLLELAPNNNQLVELEGYSNSKRFLNTKIENDTLFVLQTFPNSDTVLVASEGDYPIIVRAGAQSIESITILKDGKIDIPVRPYGSNPDGEIVYKENDWKKYVIRKDQLLINLIDNGRIKMFSEIKDLKLNFKKKHLGNISYQHNEILGTVQNLSIIHPEGLVQIYAPSLVCDSLTVLTDPTAKFKERGQITMRISSYLKAEIYHDLDIAYTGNPEINKFEKDLGRVININ